MSVIISFSLYLMAADFSICTADSSQAYIAAIYAFNQYYVFWRDWRAPHYVLKDIYGARVSRAGAVLDPDGKKLCTDTTRCPSSKLQIASDGSNLMLIYGRN